MQLKSQTAMAVVLTLSVLLMSGSAFADAVLQPGVRLDDTRVTANTVWDPNMNSPGDGL